MYRDSKLRWNMLLAPRLTTVAFVYNVQLFLFQNIGGKNVRKIECLAYHCLVMSGTSSL